MEAPAARTLGPGEGLARGGQGVWVYTLENFHPWRNLCCCRRSTGLYLQDELEWDEASRP